MVAIRTAFFGAFGALMFLALHFALSPALGGKCHILCRPERAVLAGLVLGGLVGFFNARSRQKEARSASKGADGGH